jgi:hypothetical protein
MIRTLKVRKHQTSNAHKSAISHQHEFTKEFMVQCDRERPHTAGLSTRLTRRPGLVARRLRTNAVGCGHKPKVRQRVACFMDDFEACIGHLRFPKWLQFKSSLD